MLCHQSVRIFHFHMIFFHLNSEFNFDLFFQFPVIYLGQHDGVNPKDLESVRAVMSGAAPLGALDVEQFYQK